VDPLFELDNGKSRVWRGVIFIFLGSIRRGALNLFLSQKGRLYEI